jgi:hypothetical protein
MIARNPYHTPEGIGIVDIFERRRTPAAIGE